MKIIFSLTFLIFLFSCTTKESETSKIIKEWNGKEVVFPNTLYSRVFTKDTIVDGVFENDFKLLLHVDSTGCSGCKLQLYAWKEFMDEYSEKYSELSFIYVIHSLNPFEIAALSMQAGFDYPIFYDIDGDMNKINNFPEKEGFRCFLLDKDNKVIMIGNPIRNPLIKDNILKLLDENKKKNNLSHTVRHH